MFSETEKYQKKKQSEKILNKIQVRTQQLSQVLDKNNSLFVKGLPSKDRMIKILEHSYNCYDQLDFIMLQNAQNALVYIEPKKTAEQAHKIIRTTKYLMNNIKCWMQSSLNNMDSYQEDINCFFPQKANYQPQCSTCNCYLEALIVKQAKQEIFGYQRLRQEFQLEIKEQKNLKNNDKDPQQSKHTTQYISSVNFLTKLIKQMEQSALTYDQLAQRIQKDDQKESLGVKYLEELLNNLKVKLGYKCIETLRKVIKSWENEQGIECHSQKITKLKLQSKVIRETICPNNVVRSTVNRQQEIVIKKLRSDVSNLEIQRNHLLKTLKNLNSSIHYYQMNQQTYKRPLQRQIIDGTFEKLLSRKSSLTEEQNSSKSIQQGKSHSGKIKAFNQHERMLAQRKRGLFSKFNLQRFSKQRQGQKTNDDITIDQTEVNKTQLQAQQSYIQEYYRSLIEYKEVGCQCEPIIIEQKSQDKEFIEKKQRRDSKLKKIVQRSSMRKNVKPKAQNLNETSTQQIFQHRKSINKSLKSLVALQKQKNIDLNPRFSIQENKVSSKSMNKVNPLKYLQANIRTQPIQQENQSSNRMITSVQNLQEQKGTNQQQGHKMNIYSSTNRLRELNLTSNSVRPSNNIVTLCPFKQNKDNLIKKVSIQKPSRIQVQENQLRKKIKLVRNILFKPEHLSLFGGVSESYSYERYVPEKRELNIEERKYYQSINQYLQNLQNFKSSVFQNVILFLSNPFEFIDKNQLQFKQISIKKMQKILIKFICFHSKKCKHLDCNHIINFNILIGLLQRS